MAYCKLCCKQGGRRSRPTCKHTYAATTKLSRTICRCSGVTGLNDSSIPHRYGSKMGKFGICEHHPEHAVRMYEILETPVRKAGR